MRPISAVADTSVWISAYVKTEDEHQRSIAFIDQIIRGRHRIFLPLPALTEIICRLASHFRNIKRDPVDALTFGKHLYQRKNINWIVADVDFCMQAAEVGSRHGLRGLDALIACTALQYECELFTYDNDFFTSSIANEIKISRP